MLKVGFMWCFLSFSEFSCLVPRGQRFCQENLPPHPASHCLHVGYQEHHSPFPRSCKISAMLAKIQENSEKKYVQVEKKMDWKPLKSIGKVFHYHKRNDPQNELVSKQIWELPNFLSKNVPVARSMPSSPHSHASLEMQEAEVTKGGVGWSRVIW